MGCLQYPAAAAVAAAAATVAAAAATPGEVVAVALATAYELD